MPDVVTIDGPAASGKSTIAKRLSEALDFTYINSGNYYRAITYSIVKNKINIDDTDLISRHLKTLAIEQKADLLFLDGEDVSETIRNSEVTSMVSPVAKIAVVRECVNSELRRVACRQNSIVEGRDIGTVVFPDAFLKIFLKASIEERARRRQRDFAKRNVDVKLEVLIEEISKRDNIDSTRKNAPLKCAADALVLDSTTMSIDEVVECVQKNIRQRCNNNKQSADIS